MKLHLLFKGNLRLSGLPNEDPDLYVVGCCCVFLGQGETAEMADTAEMAKLTALLAIIVLSMLRMIAHGSFTLS